MCVTFWSSELFLFRFEEAAKYYVELLAKIVDMGAKSVVSNTFQIAVSGGEWALAQHARMPGNVSVIIYKNHQARSSSLAKQQLAKQHDLSL